MMKISLASDKTRLSEEIQEDFDLIDPMDCTEPFKFFHKMIRTKHYRRIIRNSEGIHNFVEIEESDFNFEKVKDQRDHYEVYRSNYAELATFVQLVDFSLFENLKAKLREKYRGDLDRKYKRDKSQSSNFTLDIETMIEEFKMLIEVLSDCYHRGDLYNLLDVEHGNKICKFDIKHNKMQDMMVSFFLSKLFGSFNKVSTKLVHDFVMALASRTVKVNISTWTLFLPEFEFLNIKNWIGQKVESLVFSRLFKKQRDQIKFLFSRLNQMVQEHITEIDNAIKALFSEPEPADFKTYEVYVEVLNAKYEEINSIKFPTQKDQHLNINDICRITDIDVSKEIQSIQMEQAIADIDDGLLEEGAFELKVKRTASMKERSSRKDDKREFGTVGFRSTDCGLKKESRGFEIVGDDKDARYDAVNNFQIVDFADGEIIY